MYMSVSTIIRNMGWVEEEEEEEHKTKKIVVAYTKDLLSISNYYLSFYYYYCYYFFDPSHIANKGFYITIHKVVFRVLLSIC